MARNKLTAKFCQSAGKGKHSDGGKLFLYKRNALSGRWVFKYMLDTKSHEMGLGSFTTLSLAQARKERDKWEELQLQGIDPMTEREAQKRKLEKEMRLAKSLKSDKGNTVKEMAYKCLEARKHKLRGEGTAGRWMSPLTTHVFKKIGDVPIFEIDRQDLVDIFKPIWTTSPDVARKGFTRLRMTCEYAHALGVPVELNEFKAAATILGDRPISRNNIESIPWREIPDFWPLLAEPTSANLALKLLILTGLRSKPIRLARYSEIVGDVWTVPAKKMKGRIGSEQEFRVPLSRQAIQVIEITKMYTNGEGYIFASPKAKSGVISDMTMSSIMKRLGLSARPHGFRSSLRTWTEEIKSDVPYEVKKLALAHVNVSSVDSRYQRSDLLDARKILMQEWADVVTSEEVDGKIVSLKFN